ncbi:ComEC/Rec2 family competence protein [Methylocystis parvus]|uniref:ComEC family competence protein n=1 Tax=Methylocystis parvus TaxID=134 RepID=A0A6B8M9U6_9HYPH|nr:ComEC/Rec2 family competence protein [Methylocystis parvus]QGM98369.1 ComEC family competence protein [Methylocystis parvus]WBK01300.1 ComEC family competence protein [Methylocystis parvus OBBP]
MSDATRAAEQDERGGAALALPLGPLSRKYAVALQAAYAQEVELGRPFLWRAVAAGAGVVLYFAAEREPSLILCFSALALAALLAFVTRRHARAHAVFLALAFTAAGFAAGAWRSARVAAPIATRIGVGELTGFVEEIDLRPAGARFIMRVASAEGLPDDITPARVRLTTRGEPAFAAGDFIGLKARIMPPARAALPGGYDFARDAFFARLGGVGNSLGRIEIMAPPDPASLALRFFAAIDRMRNALASRVYKTIGGDAGAIAAAMVTGKRDYLSEGAKDLIRRAGIFHIVTISGMQMTLVAGIFFVGLRRLLAMSQTLALNYPIKKWAAGLAMIGAVLYDVGTGSRVGTERALVMTLIMLAAVLFDRPSLSMRNLALAAFFVVVFEPEAILGASFQLSFAAVAALIAVYEWRGDYLARARAKPPIPGMRGRFSEWREALAERLLHGPGAALVATLCATAATASFMANDFHELSPYVLIGNPLTLAVIEFFAVPCALIGAALYPFGLDGFVWRYLEMGIHLVTWLAGLIASAPGASLNVPAFAPWAIVFLALAVLSVVLWRSWTLRATAIPFVLVGLAGATSGAGFDIAVPATGDAAALRQPSGELTLLGKKTSAFAAEQWLRADADSRDAADAKGGASCDDAGCIARAVDGRVVALVLEKNAFLEDCARAAIVVTPLRAPEGCAAPIVIDRGKLSETGAVSLRLLKEGVAWRTARGVEEDRPWSPRHAQNVKHASVEDEETEKAELAEPLE